jgi:hypothetical protein
MSVLVAPIVEGYGDVDALPVLLRRMAPSIIVKRPIRIPRTKLLTGDGLSHAAAIAAANVAFGGGILLVIDADKDCAAEIGPELESRLSQLVPKCLCRAVLAVREFEAWIVGGDPAYNVNDADSAGDLKGRIRNQHGVYKETADQARLIASCDLERLSQSSRSFRRLQKIIHEFESVLR